MRIVGRRKTRAITLHASAELLRAGALFNDEIHRLPTGHTTYFPKGIYRYHSHEDANAHWVECVIHGIAQHAKKMSIAGQQPWMILRKVPIGSEPL